MNEDPNQSQATNPQTIGSPLQFEKAEFAGEPLLTCAACKAPITDQYFQVNGQNVCAKCRANIEAFAAGGSKITRFGKAAGAGIGAGFVGFLLYYIVLELTNINFGLIAIAVGWMVGKAVHWGANRIGGRFYQLLAVAITYVAICATYVPMILREAGGHDTTPFIFKFIVACVLSLAVPWLEGPSNIIGWIIIGFGLMQAWQMNRKLKIEVSGPFFTRQSVPPAAT